MGLTKGLLIGSGSDFSYEAASFLMYHNKFALCFHYMALFKTVTVTMTMCKNRACSAP